MYEHISFFLLLFVVQEAVRTSTRSSPVLRLRPSPAGARIFVWRGVRDRHCPFIGPRTTAGPTSTDAGHHADADGYAVAMGDEGYQEVPRWPAV